MEIIEIKKEVVYGMKARYMVAERILRCKFPYGGQNEIHEGYVVIDTTNGNTVGELIANRDEARNRASELNQMETE